MTRLRIAVLLVLCLLMLCPTAWAKKSKSGVAPQVLTLPKGGGAVKGLGETFVPDLNSGTGAYRVPLALPAGRNGYGPSLALSYSSGRGNGPFGLGWSVGVSQIARRTEKGVPRYNDDEDIFTYNGMELIPITPGEYRPRYEGFFGKLYHRKQAGKDFWEVWTRDGERLFFGDQPKSRIDGSAGASPSLQSGKQIFAWKLTKRMDPNGNEIIYTYTGDGGTNLYLWRIDYAIYAVEFTYEKRSDAYTHYRSGFGIETGLRCVDILVRLNIPSEGRSDRIRRYELKYSQSTDSQISLLTRIVQYGTDDSALLPPLELTYSQFDPKGSYRQMKMDMGAPPASLADPNYELADVNADGLADVLYTGDTGHLYWLNYGIDRWASAQPVRRAPQGVQLSDDGVLLADMDGDGKSDLLFTRGSSFGYWRSYGNKEWEEFVRFRKLPNFSFKNPNVRMMDVNGDGLTDVIHTTNRYYTYWLNLDGRAWAHPVSRRYASIFKDGDGPGTFFSNNPESDARLADMNGDGLQDIVSVHNGWIRYWPHRGYLRFDKMVQMKGMRRLPSRRFQRNRFLMGDINNDGFADLVYVDVTQVYYWFNVHGASWSEQYGLESVPYAQGDTDVRLADMNGNGTRDLVWSTPVRRTDRTNYRYFDFVGAGNYPNLLTEIDSNMGLVTQITYKPVIADFIEAKRKRKPWNRKLPIAVKVVASVKLIDNISHNEVETRYTYADGYYDGRDREFRGFEYAEERTIGDTSSPDSLVKDYFYVGYAERMNRENAEKARSLKGQLKRREVYGLDGSKLEGKPYQIVTHRWDSAVLNEVKRVDARGYTRKEYVVFPFLKGALTSTYERTDTPRHTAVAYEYDTQYGAVKKMIEYGEVQGWDPAAVEPADTPVEDMRVTTTQYVVKDDSNGYIVRHAKVLVTDKDGTVLSEAENFYDGAAFEGLPLGQTEKGNLHRVRKRVSTPAILAKAYAGVDYSSFKDIPLDEWVNTARYEYGKHGLLKALKDARDNVVLQVEYDAYDLFPTKVTDSLTHILKAEYDYIVGQIKRYTDANLAATDYTFDKLGLVERVVKSGDSLAYPTSWYQYNLHIYREQIAKGASKPSPPYVTAWTRERPPKPEEMVTQPATPGNPTAEQNARVTRTFFDGLGRTIQTRSEEAGGKALVSGWTEYNAKGEPKTQYLPFFAKGFDYMNGEKPPASTGEANIKTEFYYDPSEKLIRIVNPDNTYSEVKQQPWRSVNYDEEDVVQTGNYYNTPKETVLDAYGRLIQVTEYASKAKKPITTKYRYDLSDNLIEITDATGKDANKHHIIYDLLGRKLYSYEPNTGMSVYFYDQNGNLIYRRDNKKQWVKYEYDALNRLVKKYYVKDDGPQLVVANIYDAGKGQNLKGRLAKMEDLSGSVEYSYDARGRVIRKTRRLKGPDKDFITEYQYDSMDQITQVTYPDTKHTVVTYEYDEGNHLKRIPGYVDEITYNAKGQRQSIKYANGVRRDYSYDPQTFLLSTLKTTSKGGTDGDLQHLVYTHDNVGNIITITDKSLQASQQKYEYDALYRLTHALSTGQVSYDITYGYDDIGNMIQKSDLAPGTFQYGSDGRPHTLDIIQGTDTLSYDDNGNLEQTPEMTLYWDFEGRLVKVQKWDGTMATYIYDGDGMRTAKKVKQAEVHTAYYVDRLFEIRDGQEFLYVFDGQTRVARADAQGQIAYYHGDHLGSTSFQTEDGGKIVGSRVKYGPYGKTLDVQTAIRYGYNDKEFDVETGLSYYGGRYYAPKMGYWISPDPRYVEENKDDLDIPLQWNLYSYCIGNPIAYIDPAGSRKYPPPLTLVYSLKYLKQYNPETFRAAEGAYGKYFKYRRFEKTYWALYNAASNSTLTEDIFSRELVLRINKKHFSGLLRHVLTGQISGKIEGHSLEMILGKKLAAWYGIAKQLDDMRKQIYNRRLLGRNDKAAREERFNVRLKLLTAMKANDIAKEVWRKHLKSCNPRSIQIGLYLDYKGFESAYRDYGKYIELNQKLYIEKKLSGRIPLSERKPKYEAVR